jgi:signal transduction histidine kinase
VGFRFAARTLLELGKELISSDEVALYELIKNSIDAGSPRVEIVASVVLPHSAFLSAMHEAEQGKTKAALDLVRAGLIASSRQDIAEDFLAPLERALKRSRFFQATLKTLYRRYNWIEVRDTGEGMSLAHLNDVYLTVGTRFRRQANILGGTYLGDKGVGRLSAMRLGNFLYVKTSMSGERRWNKLRIDWSLFGHDIEKSVEDISISPTEGSKKEERTTSGTTVRISDLTADWTFFRFEQMFQGQIARMIDPFQPGKGNRLLSVSHNGSRIIIPSIPRKLLDSAHATLTANLSFDAQGVPSIEGLVDYRLRGKQRVIAQKGAEVYSITQRVFVRRGKRGHAATAKAPIPEKALRALGPVDVKVYWFNRKVVEAVEGVTTSVQTTRAEIAKWSGGPMLYRHGFRVLPYGNPDDDWVELDKNAFGQSGFKLNRQQVIGRVGIESAHTALSEQTNREGLVNSEASDALVIIMKWLLHSEMRELINLADRAELMSRREAESLAFDFRRTQQSVEESLEELRLHIGPDQLSYVDQLARQIALMGDQCEEIAGKSEKIKEESSEDREKFVHLAGIGLMTEFIFHELCRAVDHTIENLGARSGSQEGSLKALEAQLLTLQKRLSAFDELTGEKRQTKSTFELSDIVNMVLENHANQFKRHSIKVHFEPSTFKIRGARGMMIQILENLVSNSVYWLRQQKKFEANFEPELWIEIDPKAMTLTFEDNGPGVDPRRRETVFEPFVTSKPPGQGRGLGLYISRELAEYHDWKIYLDEKAGRKRVGRLNMFVLDMGGEK